MADTVAKVENRTTLEISRKPMFKRLYRCNARDGRYEGRLSSLCKTLWSPRRRVRNASGYHAPAREAAGGVEIGSTRSMFIVAHLSPEKLRDILRPT
jgi:hypothetical protein